MATIRLEKDVAWGNVMFDAAQGVDANIGKHSEIFMETSNCCVIPVKGFFVY